VGVVKFLTAGLFIGQSNAYLDYLQELALAADSARRHDREGNMIVK